MYGSATPTHSSDECVCSFPETQTILARSLGISHQTWNEILRTFMTFAVERVVKYRVPEASKYILLPATDEDLSNIRCPNFKTEYPGKSE